MSVLINGMEMPKCCEECVAGAYEYNDNDERCFVCGFIKSQHPWECEHVEIDGIDTTKVRADFCPLIEVPPHGRLGDLDELYEEISNGNKSYNGIEGYDGEYPNIGNVDDCLDAIKYADTVIEAED